MNTVDEALEALRAGRPVIVTDDESRENEADVILAAGTLTTEWLAGRAARPPVAAARAARSGAAAAGPGGGPNDECWVKPIGS